MLKSWTCYHCLFAPRDKMPRVAAVQYEPIWGDLDATVERTLRIIEDAASKGVQVLAFPELWLPGVSFHSKVASSTKSSIR